MKQLACVATLVACMLSFESLAQQLHPKLKAGEKPIKALVLLPPAVEISKLGVKGNEPMYQESEETAAAFTDALSRALQQRGFDVALPFTAEALKDHDELRYELADVNSLYDQIAPQLHTKEKDVSKGRFSLGDSVAALNSGVDADALVFVHSNGMKQTKGKAFMTGGLIGMATSGGIQLRNHLTLVDSRTGEVLYICEFSSKGVSDKAVQKALKKLPTTSK